MRSDNFEIYSTASEGSTRETLTYFEQIRSFFLQTTGKGIDAAPPITLVAFGSPKEYEPYRLNDFATAYYHQTVDHDYIVLGSVGVEKFPVAVHEYVHFVTRHQNLKLPVWLNEGVAEVYSTLKPQAGKILVGSMIPGRHEALLREKWVPLSVILGVDHQSPYYNEKAKAGNFYNEAWALTHMLMLGDSYRPLFPKLLAAVDDGSLSAEVLTKIYGKPVAALEKDLQGYLRGDRFAAAFLPAKLPKIPQDLHGAEPPPFDVGLLLAQLTMRPGKLEESRKAFEALAVQEPQRPEPYATLAYLDWQARQPDAARVNYRKAFERGDRNPRVLWDYGRLSEADAPEATKVFEALLALEPGRADVRMELAQVQLRARRPGAALATLAPLQNVTPDDAPRLFKLLSYTLIQLENRDEARKAAQRWQEVAKTGPDKDEAASFLERIAVRRTNPTAAAPPVTEVPLSGANEDTPPPALQRRTDAPPVPETPVPARQPAPELPSVEGTFIQLDCQSSQASVVLQTATGRKVFLIQDPNGIVVTGKDTGQVDLTCGPQKNPPKMRIQYRLMTPAKPGVAGTVREIEFQ